MKKSILIFTAIIFLGALSCKKKNDPITAQECTATINGELKTTGDAFAADPTNSSKCLAYLAVVGKLVNCPGVDAATKAQFQQIVDSSPCK